MKRIGVTANTGKPRASEILARLAARARTLGIELVACDDTAKLLPGCSACPLAEMPGRIEALMALGGDGTMLHAARLVAGRDVPLLGVNLGSLGFLTSVADENVEAALDSLAGGGYAVSARTVAEATLHRGGRPVGVHRALNDIVIGWGESSRIVTLALRIQGEDVSTYACDGLILSTPTGSTGHSLSAGGPILHPESPVFVLNPICPHTLSNRPMVIPDDRTIEIEVRRSSKNQLFVIDGQDHQTVVEGDHVVVRRAVPGVRLVHLPGYSYFSVLRQKLHWRGSNV